MYGDPVAASGPTLTFANGKTCIDYDMDGGRILAGYNFPAVLKAVEEALFGRQPPAGPDYAHPAVLYPDDDTALAVLRDHAGDVEIAEPFDPQLETEELRTAQVLDMRRGWGRFSLMSKRFSIADDWEYVLLGPSAAAGFKFGAVLARSQSALPPVAGVPEATSVAAARALGEFAGPLAAVQTGGRAERLAGGVAEVGTATGIELRAVQPGGLFRLVFADATTERRFCAEMAVRGFVVPQSGPWYPSLAHGYFDIEATVDAAAAAFVAAAD